MFSEQDVFAELTLPPRAFAALTRNQITSTEALLSLNARQLRALPGVGSGIMRQILEALAEADLPLAEDILAPYTCVRRGERSSDVSLATFFLCPDCCTRYADGAFSGHVPQIVLTETDPPELRLGSRSTS